MLDLRDYQQTAVEGVRNEYKQGQRSPLLALSTGGGKTVIFSYIAENAAQKGKKVLIMAHRKELIRQAVGKLKDFGVNAGVIAPGYTFNPAAMIQVASVQTLVRRLNIPWRPDLIVIDEAHHTNAGNYIKILEAYPEAFILGVTATPCRADGKGLGDHFGALVEGPPMGELIARGYLSPYRAFAPPPKFNAEDFNIVAGDYNKKAVAAAMDKPIITGDAVAHYSELCPGQPAIAFCSSVAHAMHTAEIFREAGYRFEAIDGKTDAVIREDRIQALGDGRLHGLCSCDIISEGTDIPVVTAAIMLRPTMSLGLFLQQAGRVLRPVYAPGFDLSTVEGRLAAQAAGPKPNAYIIDHVGNINRHGLPDDDHKWSLHRTPPKQKRKKDEENIKIRVCTQCFAVNPPNTNQCSKCGFIFIVEGRDIEEVDGKLAEVKESPVKKPISEKKRRINKARTLAQLSELEKELGYKPGWALHVFNSRKGR